MHYKCIKSVCVFDLVFKLTIFYIFKKTIFSIKKT